MPGERADLGLRWPEAGGEPVYTPVPLNVEAANLCGWGHTLENHSLLQVEHDCSVTQLDRTWDCLFLVYFVDLPQVLGTHTEKNNSHWKISTECLFGV